MKTKARATVLVAAVLGLLSAGAVSAQQARLSQKDIDRFVSSYKAMTAEFEALEDQDDSDDEKVPDLVEIANQIRNSAEAMRIARRYGWSDSFPEKYAALIGAYMLVFFGDAADSMGSQAAALDADPSLTAEQKAQMRQAMAGMQGQLAATMAKYRTQVHPSDVQLVQDNRQALEGLVDEDAGQ